MWHLGSFTVSVACCISYIWVKLSCFFVCVLIVFWKVNILLLYYSNLETDASLPSLVLVVVLFIYLMISVFILYCSAINYHKLGWLKENQFIILLFRGQKLKMIFLGLISGWQLGYSPSGGLRGDPIYLPFAASKFVPQFLTCGSLLSSIPTISSQVLLILHHSNTDFYWLPLPHCEYLVIPMGPPG